MNRAKLMVVLVTGISLGDSAVADDKPATPAAKPAAAAKADAGEVKSLIDQLRSGKYKERNDATKKLMSAGISAIEPVAKAAATDDLELGARCVDVLKHYLENGDAASKAAAQKALTELQRSKHASVAKWASEALQRQRLRANPAFGRNRAVRGGRFGNIAGPLGFQREIKTVDNGKTVEIKETILPGNRSIVVKITEKVNGKDKTTEYKATTPADLAKKNKAAHDLYVKHIRKAQLQIIGPNNAAIPVQVQIQGGGIAGGRRGGFSISTSVVNGKRTIRVSETDQNSVKRTVIQDQNGKDITVTVTETVNGKRKTSIVTAKDLAELKKKSPEAAKSYERFTNQAGVQVGGAVIRGQFGGFNPVRPAVRPVPPPQQPPRNNNNRIDSRKEIEKAKAQLQTLIDKLQKLAASGNAESKDLRKVADEIKAVKQALERATRNLEP